MIHFEKLNEEGQIERLREQAGFSFHYSNSFYGACDFTGRLVETTTRGLTLDRASVEIQHQELRHGITEGLLNSAEVFFNRILHQFSKPEEIDPQPKTSARSFGLGSLSGLSSELGEARSGRQ